MELLLVKCLLTLLAFILLRSVNMKLTLVKTLVTLWSYLSLPIYYVIQRPWIKKREARRAGGVRLDTVDKNASPVWVRADSPSTVSLADGHRTLDTYLDSIFKKYSERKCLGFRGLALEVEEKLSDGKVLTKKVLMPEYTWFTYGQIEFKVDMLTKGFHALGIKPKDTVIILMETRLEWLLSFLALTKLGATMATLYTTLGEEAIVYAANLVEGGLIITNINLIKMLCKIAGQLPHLKSIVYVDDSQKPDVLSDLTSLSNSYRVQSLEEVGKETNLDIKTVQHVPEPNDTVLIMFTSGSTGVPKGVTITHKAMIANQQALHSAMFIIDKHDTHCAILPLAHILELTMELCLLGHGASIGYSSTQTLTDNSPFLQKGCPGDIVALKPSLLIAVPLVLDKMKKGMKDKVQSKGESFVQWFNYSIDYKNEWVKAGYDAPLLNAFLFNKIKQIVGGNLRLVVSAGAPLSEDTQTFIETVLSVKIIQGYGTTETLGGVAATHPMDLATGRVGCPLTGARIKLIPWEDGGYFPSDWPHPRGEVLAGGPMVASGYFKAPDLTDEAFWEEEGIRWFRTGDIGEMHPDGVLKIIDRAKDLVKLAHGEYISLGKVEAVLKGNEFVENICIYGDSFRDYAVALVSPNLLKLKSLAKSMGRDTSNLLKLSSDPIVVNSVLESLRQTALTSNLHKYEVPRKVALCLEEWSPATDLLTAAMKLRRKNIYNYYKERLNGLYASQT